MFFLVFVRVKTIESESSRLLILRPKKGQKKQLSKSIIFIFYHELGSKLTLQCFNKYTNFLPSGPTNPVKVKLNDRYYFIVLIGLG